VQTIYISDKNDVSLHELGRPDHFLSLSVLHIKHSHRCVRHLVEIFWTSSLYTSLTYCNRTAGSLSVPLHVNALFN